ncbi:xanthine dehydrogenase accessory protein XdhC [Marinobacterium mangrovicola]|uniref:Molybdenum cofactor sulfurylase n=1 Tax=Marinobacterium mangrovicola TaxID=1476959 RepID=A0A4R1GLT9_9GAMM|nr:xanthine dehydrogenase accessory protein XdhC [Marinobacterium mangrovicola]TCK09248.1 molybdenum cofactor sulfurylase [Marinobacterium mangrovicola]
MNVWGEALAELQRSGDAHVIVTLIGTRGSTPRESGSKMLVTAEQSYDTIGGGHLEFKAIQRARELLLGQQDAQILEQYPLGATLGQCCGGQVSVLFEFFAPRGKEMLVFGAGHVAKALIPVLAGLPLRVRWIDNRDDMLPQQVPANISTCMTDDPVAEVETAAPGAYMLVLTHNHQLDFELAEAALKRGDSGFLGVIGSATKARRFRQRLEHRGFDQGQIERMVCPVGLAEVGGKRPMEVAVSIAAQIIGLYQNELPEKTVSTGIDWRTLKQAFSVEESNERNTDDQDRDVKHEA